MQKTMIAAEMLKELDRANQLYGTSFHSPHEGYAVILEEMDELFDEIRKRYPYVDRLREEAIQIGAMTIKFIQSLEHWPWLELKMSKQELKCLQCRYRVITTDILAILDSDPCLTCKN